MPRVLNHRTAEDLSNAVYIGRPTKWGNPFKIGRDMPRDRVIKMYEQFLAQRPHLIAEAKATLKGKDLVCFCAPLACHGEVLLRVANE